MPSTRWRAALFPTIRGNPEQGNSPLSATSSDAASPTPKGAVWLIAGASLAQHAFAAILDHLISKIFYRFVKTIVRATITKNARHLSGAVLPGHSDARCSIDSD